MPIFTPLIKKLGVNKTAVLVITLFVFVVFSFGYFSAGWRISQSAPAVYFLDVGQGDSELVLLPGGVEILIDGGLPNGRALEEVNKILPFTDRYLDLLVVSHPQLDHFGGLIEVMERYKVGAFLYNGRKGESSALSDLEEEINEGNIEHIILEKGDRIRYGDYLIEVLSPGKGEKFEELNDSSLVLRMEAGNSTFLFTGDISGEVERNLGDIGNVDVLKVPHHGSKYSSSREFLNVVRPKISVIEVGENNYGHPHEETLERLKNIGSRIYRTDRDGTIKMLPKENSIEVFTIF